MPYNSTLKHGEPLMADYTPASAVSAGDTITQGELVGLALHDIDANVLGALAVNNFVATCPKATGGGTALAAGSKAYWDASYERITGTADSNKQVGLVEVAAADGDDTVDIVWIQFQG